MGLRENDKNYVPCVRPQVGDTCRALSSVPPEAPTPTPCQGDRVQSGGGGRLGLISILGQLIVYVYLLLYMGVKLSRSSWPLADSRES